MIAIRASVGVFALHVSFLLYKRTLENICNLQYSNRNSQ